MTKRLEDIKTKIIEVLMHPEAEDGLYFRNFYNLHEEDERPIVEAEQEDILDALCELTSEGKVRVDESGEELVFFLSSQDHHQSVDR